MKVLVTGGAGYVGSHACKALARAGHEPVVYDNLSVGHRSAVRWGELVVGELADGAHLREVLTSRNIEAVMHFAASAYVGPSMKDPRSYYTNNVLCGLELLNAMLDTGVRRIVFSSSCASYGIQHGALIDETHAQLPVNAYGETKVAFERALHWYGNAYGFTSVILRYFNAAGADPDGEIGEDHDPEPHLLPNVLRVAAGELPCVEVLGSDYPTPDGTPVRDYVHVSDLAVAHTLALERFTSNQASIALNLGTGRGYSVLEVVAHARAVVGREIPVKILPRRPGDPPLLVADGRAASATLTWSPSLSDMPTMLRTAWAWRQRAK